MTEILHDYQNGNEAKVWKLIREFEAANRFAEIEPQVDLVIQETFRRIEYNCDVVFTILSRYGYEYVNFGEINEYNTPFLKADAHTHNLMHNFAMQDFEDGVLPKIVFEFYKRFKVLDFRGEFPDIEFNVMGDQLYLFSIDTFVGINETAFSGRLNGNTIQYALFAPDGFVKENISGDIGYGFPFRTNKRIDDIVVNFEKELLFIEYLNLCFNWACIPGLRFPNATDAPEKIEKLLLEVRSQIKQI